MILRTRDQVDLVDAVVGFHLNAGVDFVIAVDHASEDGTAEILEGYARAGYARVFRDRGEAIVPRRTQLARLAATTYGADWVIHPDGDEFWWPRGGTWKKILAAVPPRFGAVRGAWRHFAPRPEAGAHFAERLVVRVSPYAERTTGDDPFHSGVKVAHRAHPEVEVRKGHDATVPGLSLLRGWYPFEILHFPLRGPEQARRKYRDLASGLEAGGLSVPAHVERARREIGAERWEDAYEALVASDEGLEARLDAGTLVLDTRLRDALRLLAGERELSLAPTLQLPGDGAPKLEFGTGGALEAAAYAHDVQVLQDFESDVRVRVHVDALERRVDRVERATTAVLSRLIKR